MSISLFLVDAREGSPLARVGLKLSAEIIYFLVVHVSDRPLLENYQVSVLVCNCDQRAEGIKRDFGNTVLLGDLINVRFSENLVKLPSLLQTQKPLPICGNIWRNGLLSTYLLRN